ncbi:MAG TPA: flagellar export chaperone FliS [Armatimonadota bacterium]|jgi:flagellar protein FliS
MLAQTGYAQYQANQVRTSREDLLIMLYDGALRFLRLGKEGMLAGKRDQQSFNINKAQAILMELINTLNHKVGGELPAELERLYWYFFDRLTQSNLEDDAAGLDEVMYHMNELREAWVEAAKIYREQQQTASLAGVAVG